MIEAGRHAAIIAYRTITSLLIAPHMLPHPTQH